MYISGFTTILTLYMGVLAGKVLNGFPDEVIAPGF